MVTSTYSNPTHVPSTSALTVSPADSRTEYWLVVFLLLMFARVALPSLLVGTPDQFYTGTLNDPFTLNIIYRGCYVLMALMALRIVFSLIRVFSTQLLLSLFLCFICVISVFSSEPRFAIPAAIEYLFAATLGGYIALRFSFEQYIKMLLHFFIITLILSLFFIFFIPHLGLHPVGGTFAWRGAFQNKNSLGLYLALGAPLFLLYARTCTGNAKYFYWVLCGMSVLCVIKSSAVTSYFLLLATLSVVVLFRVIERRTLSNFIVLVLMLCGMVMSVLGFIIFFDEVLVLFGKDATLTGRVDFMVMGWQAFLDNPFFGTRGAPIYITVPILGVIPGNAFVGHVIILSAYGAVGFLLYFMLMVKLTRTSFRLSVRNTNPTYQWLTCFVVWWLFSNFSEGIATGVLFWSFFIAHLIGYDTWQKHPSSI